LGLEHPAPAFASLAAELSVPDEAAASPDPQHRRAIAALSIGRYADEEP
jgi:hypothetical protein